MRYGVLKCFIYAFAVSLIITGGFLLYKLVSLTINQNHNIYYMTIISGILILTGACLLYIKKTKVIVCIVVVHLLLASITFIILKIRLVNNLPPELCIMTIFVVLTYLLILAITWPLSLVLYGLKETSLIGKIIYRNIKHIRNKRD